MIYLLSENGVGDQKERGVCEEDMYGEMRKEQ